MSIDYEGIKAGQRTMWTAGEYGDIARHIAVVGEEVAAGAEPAPGILLLDVATGTGNVAIPAAQAGATVTGLDLTPKLLDEAAERARAAGVEVRWVEGDAENLPFDDDSYDRVTSCFGVMFAPDQPRAAGELTRVCRAGGRIVVAAWTPEGVNGVMFKTIASYMPPPPPELRPPVMWGVEDHVRSLFASSGATLVFERRKVEFEHASPESWVSYNETTLGPAILAKGALEAQGRWDELRAELVALYERSNEASDGSLRFSAEYLVSVATLPPA